jgi:DNA-binding PadR family transcriptional regulator
MSANQDKRRKTDLDLFILALIDGGVRTPYELQKAAGLSQGATIPALQRLLDAGFLLQGRPGPRGRTDYKVTASGTKLLQNGWLPLIEAGPSGDADADLRVALLAISVHGDHRRAVEFLRGAADRKLESIAASDQAGDFSTDVPLAQWYSELRSLTAKALLAAESKAVRSMADSLPRRLAVKPKLTDHPVKKPKRR